VAVYEIDAPDLEKKAAALHQKATDVEIHMKRLHPDGPATFDPALRADQ